MSELRVALDDGRLAFAPGEEVRGRASWTLDADPETVVVQCVLPRVEEEPTAAVEGAAEPEIIGRKAEEEGESEED